MKSWKKIKANGKVLELPECCLWDVRKIDPDKQIFDKYLFGEESGADMCLYNENFDCYEAVDGDLVRIWVNGKFVADEVVGYTCGQFIPTRNHGTVVLSMDDAKPVRRIEILHRHNVELVK